MSYRLLKRRVQDIQCSRISTFKDTQKQELGRSARPQMASRTRPVAGTLLSTFRSLPAGRSTRSFCTRIATTPVVQSRKQGRTPIGTQQNRTFASSQSVRIQALPEFDLSSKTILVTGGGRGLGLCMAQALLDSGATVYALDRLDPKDRSPEFQGIEDRYKSSGSQKLHYRQIDVRDVDALNDTVKGIADETGRMDGLIAAAGIQQETSALEYTAADANRMFEVSLAHIKYTP